MLSALVLNSQSLATVVAMAAAFREPNDGCCIWCLRHYLLELISGAKTLSYRPILKLMGYNKEAPKEVGRKEAQMMGSHE